MANNDCAVAAVVLLLAVAVRASSVVIAYGLACRDCVDRHAGPRDGRRGPAGAGSPVRISVWPRILPFVAPISPANFMAGMFDVADRYMIIHYSGAAPECRIGSDRRLSHVPRGAAAVGFRRCNGRINRHAAPFPRLGGGRRSQVAVATAIEAVRVRVDGGERPCSSPPRCYSALHSRESSTGRWPSCRGRSCTVPGLLCSDCCKTWCCERAHLTTITLFCGLVVNIGLNLVLLPRFGLLGAVVATAAANITALFALVAVCRKWGLRLDRSCWVAAALPVAVCLEPALASLVLVAVSIEAAAGDSSSTKARSGASSRGAGGYLNQRGSSWLLGGGRPVRLTIEGPAPDCAKDAREPQSPGCPPVSLKGQVVPPSPSMGANSRSRFHRQYLVSDRTPIRVLTGVSCESKITSEARVWRLKSSTLQFGEQIAEAALDLLGTRGIKELSMAGVGRQVGLVPAGIYRHFAGKDEMLDAVVELIGQRLAANVHLVREETHDAIDRLHRLLVRHVRFIRGKPGRSANYLFGRNGERKPETEGEGLPDHPRLSRSSLPDCPRWPAERSDSRPS